MPGHISDEEVSIYSSSGGVLQGEDNGSQFSGEDEELASSHDYELEATRARKASLPTLKIRLPAQYRLIQTASTLAPEEELALDIPSASDDDIPETAQWIKKHSLAHSEPEVLEPPCDDTDDSETFTSFVQKLGSLKRTHSSSESEDEDNVQLVSVNPCKARRIERDLSARAKRPETPHTKHDHASRACRAEGSPPKKRGRGRPRKPTEASHTGKTQQHFNIAVFVEIAVPPKFRPGKTPRGNKVEKQSPRTAGPFTLTHKMSWDKFLQAVSATAGVEQENMMIDGMTWNFEKRGKWPLNSQVGYHTMIQQVKAQKDLSALIIVVSLPMPKIPLPRHQAQVEEVGSEVETVTETLGLWGQKLSLDRQLAPIVERLEEEHPLGKCEAHPDLRCYVHRANGWHFDLDKNRLQIWANAILRKSTDFHRAPLGSNFFRPKDRLGDKKINEAPPTPSHNPVPTFGYPGPSPHSPWNQLSYQNFTPPSHMPPTFPGFPYGGMPSSPGYPPMPWGYPSPMASGSAHMPKMLPMPSLSTPAPSIQLTVEDWCRKHNLGDDERQGLMKLGFRVGDKLDVLSKDMWEWADLGPLHQQRILTAYSNAQAEQIA